jgi:hypothetical protein
MSNILNSSRRAPEFRIKEKLVRKDREGGKEI